ncbi:MAG TPA: helix-turn-helix domain-containing protein [Kiritimatiellia bacterium]|mgnify:CR=1 FL=1|nr:helix-turn-helix domain-containing protein [Kiritimatiellia bacterium]
MSKSDLLVALAAMPDNDPRLERVAAILNGGETRSGSLRLMRICDAARAANTSRSTIYRLIEAGTLTPVQIRPGASPRIREEDLRAVVEGRQT